MRIVCRCRGSTDPVRIRASPLRKGCLIIDRLRGAPVIASLDDISIDLSRTVSSTTGGWTRVSVLHAMRYQSIWILEFRLIHPP